MSTNTSDVRRRTAAASLFVTLTLGASLLVGSVASAAPTPSPSTPAPTKPRPVSVSVALNPYLTVEQPTDSEQTRTARAKLKTITDGYRKANQDYNRATEQLRAANAELLVAKSDAHKATAQFNLQTRRLQILAQANYKGGSGLDTATLLMTAQKPEQLLERLGLQREAGRLQGYIVQAADSAKRARDEALARVAAAQGRADQAQKNATDSLDKAGLLVTEAQELVATLHVDDLLLAARALAAGAASPAEAAAAMRAQAVGSGAATEQDFAEAGNAAAVISIAAHGMLQQAAGLKPAPRQVSTQKYSFEANREWPTDVQAVMGPVPSIGKTAPYAGPTGSGPIRSLETWQNDPTGRGYPNSGVGIKGKTPASAQAANGTTVRPVIPETPSKVRAEVAVDAALAQLGQPYVFAAAGNETFDCSGLTLWAWGHAGVPLGHFTGTQVTQGVEVDPTQMLPGDLVLFGSDLHHVALYLGAGFVIHAPYTGAYVMIQRLTVFGDYAVTVRP